MTTQHDTVFRSTDETILKEFQRRSDHLREVQIEMIEWLQDKVAPEQDSISDRELLFMAVICNMAERQILHAAADVASVDKNTQTQHAEFIAEIAAGLNNLGTRTLCSG